ncbi:hypothetical protein Cgig2_018013 [Carnegiea gigantea]|uniref:Uncharacterized protein n=1 Tax=Carnegiea gigantea TaxID=171969 RepID=A0A9Q1GKG3_9CARY|nr:hypothetical protein Cgig2_018013 [Carnegiea gigantea]
MDLGTVLSVAQTVFASLQCQELRDVCSFLGYESELGNLTRTINTVRAVLQEAEIIQMQAELPPQAQLYIEELKDAVYDADDLLDEFVTLAQRKKLSKGGKISEKVRLLLSSFNPLATAHRISRGVKEIRKRLDGIASDHTKFGFKLKSKPILRRREETCSYVDTQDIIGREDDRDKIMRKLLDPDVKRDVSCLAIVGMGGLGKTALARLVYKHPKIEENFPLRLWTCVSDQDEKTLDVKGVLSKIWHSLTHENHRDLALETLQKQLRDKLVGNKYLIVLDDVWSENRLRLLDLASYMMAGQKGSWIVVTTRSQETARILGDGLVHGLKGLSEKDSWHLFERTAFGEGHKQVNTPDLVEIGREIVKRCAGVPLAIKVLLKHWMCLRALDLSRSSIKTLPNGLDKLLHLRHLDLSYNFELETLPNSVAKLYNLQTLILRGCNRLRELPKSLAKLVKLRVLDMEILFPMINSMPRGMGKLSCLQQLPLFVVGDNNSTTKQSIVDQMEELKALTDLKGSLRIKILKNTEYIVENAGKRGYIRNKQHLSRVGISFPWVEHNRMRDDEAGLLLEDLQPHPKLRELELDGYMGSRMPSWAMEDNLAISLPNLVKVSFKGCYALQHLSSLRKFRDLKFLQLSFLNDLEYIENTTRRGNISDGAGTSELDAFFPSLETLWLSHMPKLKGWWRDEQISNSNGKHGHRLLPSFPHLIKLTIEYCPSLTCIPPCPTVEELEVRGDFNENLGIMVTGESGNSRLRCVKTSNTRCLKTILPMERFQCLEEMEIYLDDKVESLSEVGEVFRSCSSSLKCLEMWGCCKLKSLCGALEHLKVLESLKIKGMRNLNLNDKEVGEDDDGKPWQCLHQSLRCLKLEELPELVSLPKGMQYLTALRSLYIIDCKRLESLPESMRKLTSLNKLEIQVCSAELNNRCREHTGEDWPKIQHIPHIAIRDHYYYY